MKGLLTFALALSLTGIVLAQGTPAEPPKDPPAEPPKEGDPAKPPDQDPEKDLEDSATRWAKSWPQARALAAKRNGYALLVVLPDKDSKGREAGYTQRIMNQFFGNPQFYQPLNQDFGAFKGYFSQLLANGETGAKMREFGVDAAPAYLFVDPDDGKIIDGSRDALTMFELDELVKTVLEGKHRAGLERKLEDKEFTPDDKFHVDMGKALYRAQEYKQARTHYEKAVGSKDMRTATTAKIGIAFCDLKEAKYKDAVKLAQEVFDSLPVQAAPPRGACLYVQVWSYYNQNQPEEASKVAAMLLERYFRTTHGWKLYDEQMDIRYDFVKMEKIPEPPEGGETPAENPK